MKLPALFRKMRGMRPGEKNRRLYVHIGSPKTGTTTIQAFLQENRDVLKKKGYIYPGKEMNHYFLGLEVAGYRNLVPEEQEFLERVYEAHGTRDLPGYIAREIDESGCRNVIISAENFWNFSFLDNRKKIPDILRAIHPRWEEEFEVFIIVYLRRQDTFNESVYSQAVTCTIQKETRKVSENLRRPNYYKALNAWADIVGKSNILVRPYESVQLPKGIIHNFLSAAGLKLTDEFRPAGKDKNVRHDTPTLEYIRICNKYYSENRDLSFFSRKYLPDGIVKPFQKARILSFDDARRLLERCNQGNQLVARKYLGRLDGRLFYEPWPSEDDRWDQYEGLTVEDFVPIFARMLYKMQETHDAEIRAMTEEFVPRFARMLHEKEKAFEAEMQALRERKDAREHAPHTD